MMHSISIKVKFATYTYYSLPWSNSLIIPLDRTTRMIKKRYIAGRRIYILSNDDGKIEGRKSDRLVIPRVAHFLFFLQSASSLLRDDLSTVNMTKTLVARTACIKDSSALPTTTMKMTTRSPSVASIIVYDCH